MSSEIYSGVLVSDSNMANLAGYLNNDGHEPKVNAVAAPYGQVIQTIMNKELECWKSKPGFVVVWTRAQSVIRLFNDILDYRKVDPEKVIDEVATFAKLITRLNDLASYVFIPTWVLPWYFRGFGLLDLRNNLGIANMLMRMNLTLADALEKHENFYLLNTQKWIENAGENAFNTKLWYRGKIKFHNNVFKNAVKDIKAALRAISGKSKKLIILDLDDTLWGGIVGDRGWENLKLGGHDPIGEAFVDFQKELKALKNRGILLAVVSKNEEAVAIEAIRNHPEMVLDLEDFAGWRINWNDKAQNIVDLVSDLNLGLQSIVYIDDSRFERARIAETLPEIFVPDWPEDKLDYKKALQSLPLFETASVSQEDINRTKMYISERQRNEIKNQLGTIEEWLKSLNIEVKVEEFNDINRHRTNQLLNKTNQMNLTTRRLSDQELEKWVGQPNNKLWTFRVSDRLGDSGLTGIASISVEKYEAVIVDFILSCRVMGRMIEEAMLYTVIQFAKTQKVQKITAKYIPTQKNKPCLTFFQNSDFTSEDNSNFTWSLTKEYECPKQIKLIN